MPVLEVDPADRFGAGTTVDAYRSWVWQLNETFAELQRAEITLSNLIRLTRTVSSEAQEAVDATVDGLSADAKLYPPDMDEDGHVVHYSERRLDG